MTPQTMNELKEIATEVDELRYKAVGLLKRTLIIYLDEEEVENLGTHDSLTKATMSLQRGAWQLGRAATEIQQAHEAEKRLMDFFEGVQNKLHNYDKTETNNN